MEAFVERYHAWLDELLNDPGDRRRFPITSRLRDLDAHQKSLYERILKTSQARAQMQYAEADITISNGVEFYRWPGNFRRFLKFERRVDGDPNNIMETMKTIAPWDKGRRGVVLMTPERGFRVQPVPQMTEEQTWTLCYQKGLIHPHWGSFAATGSNVGPNFLRFPASIPDAQGYLVKHPQYYAGEVLRIIDAGTGGGQSIEVSNFSVGTLQCDLRHNFSPVPTGQIKYEIGGFFPEGLDKIVAVTVALSKTPMADRAEQRSLLMKEFKELYAACSHYFNSQTADRPHRPDPSYADSTVDPFAQ